MRQLENLKAKHSAAHNDLIGCQLTTAGGPEGTALLAMWPVPCSSTLSEKLKRMLDELQQHDDRAAVCCQGILCDSSSAPVCISLSERRVVDRSCTPVAGSLASPLPCKVLARQAQSQGNACSRQQGVSPSKAQQVAESFAVQLKDVNGLLPGCSAHLTQQQCSHKPCITTRQLAGPAQCCRAFAGHVQHIFSGTAALPCTE